MTWGIKKRDDITAVGPDIAPPSNWQGTGAALRNAWQSADVGKQRNRQVAAVKNPLALEARNRLGPDKIAGEERRLNAEAEAKGATRMSAGGLSPDETLDLARREAELNPDAWAGLELSDEKIEAGVTAARAEERRVADEIIALSPNPVSNTIVGEIVGAVADPLNIALAPLGFGGGALWRIMLKEAGIGALSEALQHPARKRVAAELDLPDPDLMQSLLYGAIGGAAFAGVLEGVPRGIRAFRYARAMRKAPEAMPGFDGVGTENAIRAAETALDDGTSPLDAVANALKQTPPRKYVPPPLILDSSLRVMPEPTALAPDPISVEPLPPVPGQAPTTPGETAALAEAALNDAIKADQKANKPFLDFLKSAGAVSKAAIKKAEREGKPAPMAGARYQIDPDGTLGRELKAMGVTARNTPVGMFKKGGRDDLDNLVANEMEDQFPGIMEATRTPYRADYLDRQGVIDLIVREHGGDSAWLRSRADAVAAQKAADDLGRGGYNPQEAFLSGEPSPTGFFVARDPLTDEVLWGQGAEAEFDDYLASKWPSVKFLPREVAEMKAVLRESGGEAEDLVVRTLERDIEFAELPPKEALKYEPIPFPDEAFGPVPENAGLAGPGRSGAIGRNADPQAAGGGSARAGRDNGVDGQFRIPGTTADDVARQAAIRAKVEIEVQQLQSKQRRLNQVRVEDEVDGLFSVKQLDIFDDLMSPQAQRAMDAEVQNLRAMIEAGDTAGIAAVADDGRVLNSISDILSEIDDMDTLAREFDLCRFGGGTE